MNGEPTIRANGRLRHRFWGEYSSFTTLSFPKGFEASREIKCLSLDNMKWEVPVHRETKEPMPDMLCIVLTSEQTSEMEDHLIKRFGCPERKMQSIGKSLDYGEPFSFEIPLSLMNDPQQMEML